MRVAVLTVSLLSFAAAAAGHDGLHPPAAQAPSSWDVMVLVLLGLCAVLYARGSLVLARRGAKQRLHERLAFWAGWSIIVIAVAPPVDAAAEIAFSAHMVQHELLMLAGAPLIVVGRPIVPWLWALPAMLRRHAGGGLQSGIVSAAWRWLTLPVAAWALHGTAIWVWHAPGLYEAAITNEGVHAVQHAMFFGTALLFWWGLVYGRYGRAAYGASVLYVFTTMVHTGVLGAMFALSESPLYAVYRDRAAGAGIDAAADQQLAGLYMWVPAGVVLTAAGLALLVAWISEADRRSKGGWRAAGMLAVMAVTGLTACDRLPHEDEVRRMTGGDPYRGRDRIRFYGCDTCHTIPGVPTADATVGPPLTRVARRTYLAGHIENTPENMIRWIRNPHAHEPGTAMPEMGVTDRDGRDITAYLYTLR